VINLAIRPGLDARFFDRLYNGLADAATAAGVDIVGGNVTRAEALAITIALFGEARKSVLRRDAAHSGDDIFVTGTLGDAAIGWRILAGELKARGSSRKFLVDRFLQPVARLKAGQQLAQVNPAPAAIDISDGLLQDLGHVLKRSGVGAEIESAAIPLSSAYRDVMGDNFQFALSGGEDYELLFCLRPGRSETALTRRLGVPVRRIGQIVRGHRVTLIPGGGRAGVKAPRVTGWDQLRTRGA